MIRFILGRAGAGKTARIFDEIAAQVQQQDDRGIILLVPEQYSHEAERELCRAAGDGLSRRGEVLSFTGLARKVFSQLGGTRSVMDGGGRLLCMAVGLEAVADKLKVYHRARRNPRMLEGLLGAAEELKNAGIDEQTLAQLGQTMPGALGDKLADLALVLGAYQAAQGRSSADGADVLAALAAVIAESAVVQARFYIDGFTDFTAVEKKVLRALVQAGADMTLCLTCAPAGQSPEVFSLVQQTVRWVEDTAREYGVEYQEQWLEREEQRPRALTCYCDHLFDFSREEAPAADGSVVLAVARDAYEECELAAARMAELAQGGARWRDMAVAIRGFGDYRAPLESACARYNVPLFMGGRGDMMRKSVPSLITAALEAVNRGYEYEAVFGYLKTGLAPLGLDEVDILENYALLWQVRGPMWLRPFTMHPEGYNQPWDDVRRGRLARVEQLRLRAVEPLQRLESAVKAGDTAQAQAMALGAFLEDIHLPQRLSRRAQELEDAGRQETAAEYGRLWDIVCTALEQFAAVLGDMPMDGEQFQGLFSLMLSKYDVGIIPVSLDRVQAGDMDTMRRRHTRHLLVLGAADGRVPAPEEGGGLFTPEEREALSGMGFSMGSAEEDLQRELSRIYSCLTLPSQSLYMSYPAVDSEGTETRPSLIVERARALLGLTVEPGDIRRARSFSQEGAFSLAVEAAAGGGTPLSQAAWAFFQGQGRGQELTDMVQAASVGRGQLSPAGVQTLYGDKPALSPSRAERFSECRFSYFLRYGLRAKPRQQAVFDPRDHGTFMHYVLENVARKAMEQGGFQALDAQQVGRLSDQCVDQYIREELGELEGKSARFSYLFRRLHSMVRHVAEDMWQELSCSRFQPIDLELDLAGRGVLAPDETAANIAGRVDRVDGWVKDGVLYLRITDYKTGAKKFSLSDVCQGANLQMLLYLFTLTERGKAHFGAEQIRPAGVLYVPARFELVSMDGEPTPEELEAVRAGKTRRNGLLLDDPAVLEAMEPGDEKRFIPVQFNKNGAYSKSSQEKLASLEQMGALSRYIDQTLRRMAQELGQGSVEADPWYRSAQDNACVHCDYKKACLFDEERDGWRIRQAMSAEQAWEKIREGCDHE